MVFDYEIKQKLDNIFKGIKFNKEKRVYMINDKALISVTKQCNRFYPPFDAVSVSIQMAKKEGRKIGNMSIKFIKKRAKEIRDEWKQKADDAIIIGNSVHDYGNKTIKLKTYIEPANEQETAIRHFLENLPPEIKIVASEYKVYSEKLGTLGIIDLILYNTKSNKLIIVDWKTNQTNILRTYGDNTLLPPFAEKEDCSLNKYGLQVSYYELILALEAKMNNESWVVWLTDSSNIFKTGKSHPAYRIINNYNLKKVEKNYCVFRIDSNKKKLATLYSEELKSQREKNFLKI